MSFEKCDMLYNCDVPYYLTVKIYNVFKGIKVEGCERISRSNDAHGNMA